MKEKPFKQTELSENVYIPSGDIQTDRFLTNFKGANRRIRGGGWDLKGGGSNTASFLSTVQAVSTSIIPTVNNTYALGNSSFKWSNVAAVLINGVTPRPGTLTVFVAASSGGAVTTALNINTGLIVT
jgi:hypothetical protein